MVLGLGFGIWGLVSRIWGLGLRIWGLGFSLKGLGCSGCVGSGHRLAEVCGLLGYRTCGM